jgi:hypothetical protein
VKGAFPICCLLDCYHSTLPWELRGATDIIIINNQAEKNSDHASGIEFSIKVKKSISSPGSNYHSEILLELIVADIKCEGRCSPMGMLTDLNNFWYLLWFMNDKKVMRTTFKHPVQNFEVIKK